MGYLIVYWILEGLYSVVCYTSVASPRKDFKSYEEGEEVEVKFKGKIYPAKIIKKSESRKALDAELDGKKTSGKEAKSSSGKGMKSSQKAEKGNVFEDDSPLRKKQKCSEDVSNRVETELPLDISNTVKHTIELDRDTSVSTNNRKNDNCEKNKGFSSKEMAEFVLRKKEFESVKQDHKDCVGQKDFQEMKDELKKLKKRVRELEFKNSTSVSTPAASVLLPSSPMACPPSPPPTCPQSPSLPLSPTPQPSTSQSTHNTTLPPLNTDHNTTFNGHSLHNLKDIISHTDSLYPAVRILLLQLFPEDYVISHSVSGKAANSKTDKKPSFDFRLYTAMVNILKDKFGCTNKEITEKVHSVQKSIKKQLTKK